MKSLTLEIRGEPIELLPCAGLYWPARATLFVADVHLGKSAMFRQAGVPTPEAVTAADLDRLSEALCFTRAKNLVFLGDLFHGAAAAPSYIDLALREWRRRHSKLVCQLVLGNHDKIRLPRYEDWCIEPAQHALDLPPFVAMHEPPAEACADDAPSGYALCGHIHPAAWVGAGGDGLRLPCFVVGTSYCILPAFGGFTGAHMWARREGDQLFVLGGDEVLPWNPPPRRTSGKFASRK